MHFQLYVLPLQYIENIIYPLNIFIGKSTSHIVTVFMSVHTVAGKAIRYSLSKRNNSGTIHSYCTLDVFKAYHTYFTCFTYDTHQSVGSKTTADVQYTFSVEPDILLTKEIVVVQFSHQVFDTAIQHTVSPIHPHTYK